MTFLKQVLNDKGVLLVTLDRPEKLNVLNAEGLDEIASLLNFVRTSDNVKALLFTGSGKAFCAGADIVGLTDCNAQSGYSFSIIGQKLFRELETLGKPSLAAINGFAFGGGCELAMSATLRIASKNAQFAQPEVKLGLIPGYGGTQRLARLVGKGRALDLCLTGRVINADLALNWGLVTEVVDLSELVIRGQQILETIIEVAPLACISVMEVIDRGFDMSMSDALHLETVHFANICASKDKQEGVSAFLAKRRAIFKGE